MTLTDTLITVSILLTIAILAYLKMTNKTLTDFISEIREIIKNEKEEVVDLQ